MMSFLTDCFNTNHDENSEERTRLLEEEVAIRSSLLKQDEEIIKTLKGKDFDVQKIKQMVTDKNINAKDKFQNSVLHLAVEKIDSQNDEHLHFIDFLIDKGADVRSRNNNDDTPFLWAAKGNKYKLIDMFADNKRNEINSQNKHGCTALHLAVLGNHHETVIKLHWLSKTHDLNERIVNNLGLTAKKIAESKEYKVSSKILEILKGEPKEFVEEKHGSVGNHSICMLGPDVTCDPERFHFQESSTGLTINVHEGGTAIVGDNNQITLNISEDSSYGESVGGQNQESEDSYQMKKVPRGICLIMVNEIFSKQSNLTNRTGCEVDVTNLKATFEWLQFKVEIKRNLSAYDMFLTLKEYAKYNHDDYDCFVLCILSHGNAGAIYGVDGKKLPVFNIQTQFCGDCCSSLREKPKLFFFNACRERKECVQDGDEKSNESFANTRPSHPGSDFLLAYSCPDGFPSWRIQGADSWYISALCENLTQFAESEELQHILTKVNNKVSSLTTRHGHLQIPSPVNQLRKKLWFFPERRGNEMFNQE